MVRLAYRSMIVVAALAAAVACGGSTTDIASGDGGSSADANGPGDGGSSDASHNSDSISTDASTFLDGGGRTPVNHRPNDAQCTQAAPAGNFTLMMGLGDCTNDAACTTGTNGRCVQSTHGAPRCSCSYDTCAHDTDCAAGKLCACHGSPFTAGGGNACIDGNCRVDADCGAGYCSPSHGSSGCGGLTGYYCHTAADRCTDDADCADGGSFRVCGWAAMNNRWECQPQQLCP